MLNSTKPPKCKHCKKRMPEDERGRVLHSECVEPWAAKFIAKKQAAEKAARVKKASVERLELKKRKEKAKTRGELIAEAQKAFNEFIRTRDAGLPCICCGQPFEPEKPGGSADAGHYLSRGSAPHLRFTETNCFSQRKNCNRPGGTTRQAFRAGVVARIGLAAVEALEADTTVRKWSADDLREIRATYRAKTKALKQGEEA